MVRNVVGALVRGHDLYGRDQFVELLWKELEKGSVLLAAPRRFGKTSVMYRLIDKPHSDYRIVHADLENLEDPVDLMVELAVQLAKDNKLAQLLEGVSTISTDIWRRLRNAVEEVEAYDIKLKLREQLRPQWQDVGREIFQKVSQLDQPVLFILDEFPMMIDRMARQSDRREEARVLLNWLRALRQSPNTRSVRFLIAGSIGIENVLNSLGEVKAINDFQSLKLEPFSLPVARAFLLALAESEQIDLSEDCREKMLEIVGINVPYFLQIMFSEVSKACFLKGDAVTSEMITNIYREKVLGVDCKTYFDHYYGRLRDYYSPQEERAVKQLLRELARVGTMTRGACYELYLGAQGSNASVEAFNGTISNLENDFYIRFDAGSERYEFACKLLRDWWLRHYAWEAF